MSNTVKLFLAALLTVVALFGEQVVEIIKNNVEVINTPSVNIDDPSLEFKTLMEKIISLEIEKQDAKQISDFFLELSDVVRTDPGFLDTTGTFREFNVKAGGLNFAGLELNDKYPTLGDEIDSVLQSTVGLEDAKLSDEKRKDLCDCLNAIAWGVHN